MLTLPRSHNIVGRWCPSAGATGFRLIDRSGRYNHMTLNNMDPSTDWVVSGGKVGIDLDGVDDYARTTNQFNFATLTNYHLSCWIYPRSLSGTKGFIGSDANSVGIEFRTNGSQLNFLRQGAFNIAQNAGTVTINTWQLVAINYNSVTGDWETFINGKSAASGTATTTGWGLARLELSAFTISDPFNGLIDDIVLYRNRLTSSETLEVYKLGRGFGIYPQLDFDEVNKPAGFKAYWANRRSRIIGAGI